MVSMKPPPKNWTDAIADVAKLFMNAKVCIYETDSSESDYDPITGSGIEFKVTPIFVGSARVQKLRTPNVFATEYQAGANVAFRMQVEANSIPRFISEGAKVRILNADQYGSGDNDLEKLIFVVNSAINSSHQAVKTIELTATMREIEWNWDIDDEGNVSYI
jgi:hypothetical protein